MVSIHKQKHHIVNRIINQNSTSENQLNLNKLRIRQYNLNTQHEFLNETSPIRITNDDLQQLNISTTVNKVCFTWHLLQTSKFHVFC